MLLLVLAFVLSAPAASATIGIVSRVITLAVIGYFLLYRDWTDATREQILGAATWMIVMVGGVSLIGAFSVGLVSSGDPPNLILPIFFWHLSACLFLPWTPRESLRPFIPLMAAWALLVLFFSPGVDFLMRVLQVIFGPGVFLPGLGIAAWRMGSHIRQFRSRMVGKQFLTMRREFSQAREIHENMFPSPYDDGFVKFDFTYHPMRELGGDYIHLHVGAEGLVHVTLIDVTGHGLAAALTVNRLYGELERIRAEAPKAEPGEVLSLLNRYIHLTMSKHNIYATAACVTLDPYLGELHWASAGHPPGYLRGANDAITNIDATTVVLGAIGDEDFSSEQQSMQLSPGDTLVLYTDGAFESRDRTGQQFGLANLRNLIGLKPPPGHWPRYVASAVERHHNGRTEDDILIASLTYCASRRQSRQEAESSLAST